MDTAMARGPLMLMPTTAMAVTALATAMDTAMARGPLMPMPMPTTAMVDMVMAMAVTALATAMATATARGLLMPMPTTAMVDMAATAMGATDTAMATATARGPLRPSPTTAMADTDTESKKSKSISCNNTKNPTPNYPKLTYLNGQENYGCVSFKQRQRV